jgi:hypothetical protein
MTQVVDATADVVSASAVQYIEIQQFYAHQMQAGDGDDFATWLATFTEDAVVYANAWPEPVVGRAAISVANRASSDERAGRGAVHKHFVSMINLTPDAADGYEEAVTAVFYVAILESVKGEPPRLYRSIRCEDRLVRRGGRWSVRGRRILRDDLPALATASA